MRVVPRVALIAAFVASAGCGRAAGPPDRELVQVEEDWSQASIRRDAAALSRFYADEYTFTDGDGVVTSRLKEIDELANGTFRLRSYKLEDVNVHSYGEVAVVTGSNTIAGLQEDTAREVRGAYRFTDIFVRRDGRWQCVASQASRIEEK